MKFNYIVMNMLCSSVTGNFSRTDSFEPLERIDDDWRHVDTVSITIKFTNPTVTTQRPLVCSFEFVKSTRARNYSAKLIMVLGKGSYSRVSFLSFKGRGYY